MRLHFHGTCIVDGRRKTNSDMGSLARFVPAVSEPNAFLPHRRWRDVRLMPAKNRRRHPRISYIGPIQLMWDDKIGHTKCWRTKCVDISEAGLRIEVPEAIPIGAHVSLRSDRIDLAGFAVVKHVTRCGSRYHIGLELGPMLQGRASALLGEPLTLRRS